MSAAAIPVASSARTWSDFDDPLAFAPAFLAEALAFATLPVPRFADLTMPSIAWARPNMMGNTFSFFSSALTFKSAYAALRFFLRASTMNSIAADWGFLIMGALSVLQVARSSVYQ